MPEWLPSTPILMRTRIGTAAVGMVCAGLLTQAAQAQPAFATRKGAPATRIPQGMRVTGQVHDSITGFPLSRAVVQLIDVTGSTGGRMAISDSLGHYAFTDVPTGRYTLGFHHDVLDSLGLEPLARTIDVARNLDAADLAVPSAVGIREAVCGTPSVRNPGTLLMGFVRDAETRRALPKAVVTVEWLEYQLGKRRMTPHMVRRQVTAGENGWYGVCNIPREGFVQVGARVDGDSIDHVEFEVAADALQRRELFVGGNIRTTVSGRTSDSSGVRILRTGRTRVTGVVRREGNGRPLENATVQIVNGPTARTNANGEFFFDNAPAGTRVVDVRAVGFYPQRMVVNVLDDAPALRAELRTFRSVLDTVKVLANYERYSALKEFQQRVRSGVGRYLTEETIARRNVFMVSELFWVIPGVYVERAGGLDQEISMRGVFAPRCSPALFLNGFPLSIPDMSGGAPLSAAEVDAVIRPKDLLGVEIYTSGQVPAQFGAGMTGCGAIIFWTR